MDGLDGGDMGLELPVWTAISELVVYGLNDMLNCYIHMLLEVRD